tara:strand:+ start:29429 stop:32776 length:3348 start_codon:yes stop_codon:yes gene_type:complete
MKKLTLLVLLVVNSICVSQIALNATSLVETPLKKITNTFLQDQASVFTNSSSDLVITEIFSGQAGTDLTADWFEITNNGTTAWVSGVDPDIYYDDESADPTTADIVQGITEIQPGSSVIVLITGDTSDITTFVDVWSPVIDLTGVEIGYSDGAGLGAGGDAVNIWLGDPNTSAPIATEAYPDTSANDGQSYDNELDAFSTVGNANGAVQTIALGGASADVPNIGSPGNGPAIPLLAELVITEIFSGQEGADLTADWFEIENTGATAWVSGVDEDLYYDDDSADPTAADLIQGVTQIQPGGRAIVLITGDVGDISTFNSVWSPVIDITGIEVGYTDGSGLGAGGDAVTLWMGDPATTSPVDSASYPDTAANDGQSYDVELAEFSVVGNANNAVETLALGGASANVPNIGSPGNGIAPTLSTIQFSDAYLSVSEDGGSVNIIVDITDAPSADATVEVSLLSGGTAVEGTDFTFATTETLTFLAGSTDSQMVTIPILNNSDDNSDVFFVVGLQNVSNAALNGQDVFSVYILDEDTVVPSGDTTQLDVNYLNSYLVDASGTAEITAYDATSQRLFVTNSTSIEALDFSDPNNILSIGSFDISTIGSGVQSVAVSNGIVAAAVAANDPTDNGFVLFGDIDGNNTFTVEVGSLPDMLTFSPDGTKLLVANEGQPSDDYSFDPEGTISVIDVSGGLGSISQADVVTLNFNDFDAQQSALEAAGVRIFGPGSSVSQDLEPEYIAVSNDSEKAYVSLQENNAYAIIDLITLEITDVISFGLKDHSLPENSMDTSDEMDFIFNASWPVKGMYMPDAISFYNVGGVDYIVTANEGDAREYGALEEERKIGDTDYILDPTVFADISVLEMETNLGDIAVTNASGDIDNDGDFDEIHVFGGRSFSIFEAATGTLVYDSGNDFEVITAADTTYGAIFNASNSNNTPKNRSDNKGPEPEGVLVKELNNEFYAFILLERVGGMMVYNITNPSNPQFLQYVNNRDAVAGGTEGGDLGPEGVAFVDTSDSPTGTALVILSNEVSATLSVYSLDNIVLSTEEFDFDYGKTFSIYPNPTKNNIFFSTPSDYKIYDITGRQVLSKRNAASMDVSSLNSGTYIINNANGESQKLIIE